LERQPWATKGPKQAPEISPPTNGSVPIFKRAEYAYYLTVQGLSWEAGIITLKIAASHYVSRGSTWGTTEMLTAVLTDRGRVRKEWHSLATSGKCFSGPVTNFAGTEVATLTIGWV